jgi:hypothetical protein
MFTPFHKLPYTYPYGRSVDEITTKEIKIGFERWLLLSTTGNGVLTIFHTKIKQVFLERLAL